MVEDTSSPSFAQKLSNKKNKSLKQLPQTIR